MGARTLIGQALAIAACVSQAMAAAPPPQPPAQMRNLENALSGRWTITGTFEVGPKTPDGGTVSGEEVWRSGPGGYTFMQEEQLATPFGEIFGTGFMWWDGAASVFRGLRCQNADPQGCDLSAAADRTFIRWDGKNLTIDFANKADPTQLAWHEVFSDITPNGFTQTGYSGAANGLLTKTLTIHAVRRPATP